MQDTYTIKFSDLMNHLNSDDVKRYPVTVLINGEYYSLIDDRPAKNDTISRAETLDFIKSFVQEIITESGTDKNAHTNTVLREIIDGLSEKPGEPADILPF